MIKQIMLIFIGGGLGATLRFAITHLLSKIWIITFPIGILMVNIIGCFLMGITMSLIQHHTTGSTHNFIIIGFLGGFTTFSSFANDCIVLFQRGDFLMSGVYLGGSIILSFTFLLLGIWCVKMCST